MAERGDEARKALELVGADDAHPPPPAAAFVSAGTWGRVLRMARWLGREPPPRERAAVGLFIDEHSGAYDALRAQRGSRTATGPDGW